VVKTAHLLENQIQGLPRTFWHRFKKFQGPCLFSRTFQALKTWTWKKFKECQGLSRIRGNDRNPHILRS